MKLPEFRYGISKRSEYERPSYASLGNGHRLGQMLSLPGLYWRVLQKLTLRRDGPRKQPPAVWCVGCRFYQMWKESIRT